MMSKRIVTILPELTFDESLEATKIYSISGKLNSENPIILERPFRDVYYSATLNSLIGGGSNPKPGEVSLANNGILFLDELPEFSRKMLESLRVPLEEKKVTINRVSGSVTYPCNFMLIAAMNPCPCGYYGVPFKECTCTEREINNYINKISGPLLDRIDIQIEIMPVQYKNFLQKESEDSATIKARVDKARTIQLERYKEANIYSNSEMNQKMIDQYCKLDKEGDAILKTAYEKMGLSARGCTRILKVARTIADLDGSEFIQKKHLAEAIQYRIMKKK